MADILEQSQELKKLWSGYQSTRVLITANNYKVFDHLQECNSAAALVFLGLLIYNIPAVYLA